MTFPNRDPCQKSVDIICVGLFLSSLFYSTGLHICSFVKYLKIRKSQASSCFFLSQDCFGCSESDVVPCEFYCHQGDVGKSLHWSYRLLWVVWTFKQHYVFQFINTGCLSISLCLPYFSHHCFIVFSVQYFHLQVKLMVVTLARNPYIYFFITRKNVLYAVFQFFWMLAR